MFNIIDAYKNTKYIVFEHDLIIKIGKLNQCIDKLILQYNSNEWAFITAFNPYSKVLTEKENQLRHHKLKELTKNYVTFEGHGVGEDPTWDPELSLLIIGISKDEALIIGKQFEQNAIVYGKINETPQLLILNSELK
jgi:hypothetical protein